MNFFFVFVEITADGSSSSKTENRPESASRTAVTAWYIFFSFCAFNLRSCIVVFDRSATLPSLRTYFFFVCCCSICSDGFLMGLFRRFTLTQWPESFACEKIAVSLGGPVRKREQRKKTHKYCSTSAAWQGLLVRLCNAQARVLSTCM